MGNYRFKFSDMIPNAWFYKLKDTSTTKTKTPKTHQTKKKHEPQPQPPRPVTTSSSFSSSTSSSLPFAPPNSQRKSYYFTRDLTSPDLSIQTHTSPITRLPDPPRKSSKKRRSTKRSSIHHRKSSPRLVSAGCSTHTTVESVWAKPEYNPPDPYPSSSSGSDNGSLLPKFGSDRGSLDNMVSSLSSLQHCKLKNDDVDYSNISSDEKFQKIHDLPPIITKSSPKFEERNPYGSLSVKVVKQELQRRKFPANSPVKLRTNSPRIMARSRIMVQVNNGRRSLSSTTTSSGRLRRSLSESFAVPKSSVDPQRDFKESMVEMIMENNIRGSKDLEELLECYLSLNSDEYHELIIKVFKQIWFDISDIRFK